MSSIQSLLRLLLFLRWPVVIGLLAGLLYLQWTSPRPVMAVAEQSYADAVRHAAPAVVNIYTTRLEDSSRAPILRDPFLPPFPQSPYRREQTPQVRLGSGVILDPQGLILTNYHVIQQASSIHVALQDGREADARVLGVDPDTDLALLDIDLDPLPAIALAAPDSVRIGDIVLAIGNPFGVGQTVTQGIVSALGRNELGLTTIEDFVQTDAAINPGNSGGALINTRGELVGINTAIVSHSGGNQGIGFAIPAWLAHRIMQDLQQYGRVVRGYLGVEMQQLGLNEARFFNLQHTNGLLITGVHRNSPAEEAGIKPGDVVLSIDGQPIHRAVEALNQVTRMRPGTPIQLGIYRQGQILQLQTEVSERPLDLSRRQ